MKKIYLLICFISLSCANYNVKIAEESTSNIFKPKSQLSSRVYLIGDTGYSPAGNASEGLLALNELIKEESTKNDFLIVLGDNIYPSGMPPESSQDRVEAEARLEAQLKVYANFKGSVIMIPGNHDWRNKLKGVKEQQNLVEDFSDKNISWLPKAGCGISGQDLSDKVYLITIDSQWFLEDWDQHPNINKSCEEIKTREQFIEEFDTEIKKNQNKTVLVSLHHPLYSNGIHGGQFEFTKHLYPSSKKIPLPGLASLANLIRATGGVSKQDIQNQQYQSLVKQLEARAKKWGNVIFTSGHEHSLQYLENARLKQIVSGSGSKFSYVKLGLHSKFAYPGQGFAVLDIYKDQSSQVKFYQAKASSPHLIYKTQIHQPHYLNSPVEFKENNDKYVEASIYEDVNFKNNATTKAVWGEHYRQMYTTPIQLKSVKLDTLYGGLSPMRLGGGNQTNSLRLNDSLGREYNIRELKKDAVRLLQTNVYQDEYLQDEFNNTVIESLLDDFMTASHPFGFLAIPDMAEALGVYHTNPELFYIPKQEVLGKFNQSHGNSIYMIEERPEEHWISQDIFGNPNHDIVSTADMYERLKRDEKYKLDEQHYIKSRVFDILIGDFDRHGDQWRWAEFENINGKDQHLFRAIPRDRDQVFSNFDGGFLNLLRAVSSFPKIYQEYGSEIEHVNWYSYNTHSQDRNLMRFSGKDDWLKAAKEIQLQLSDSIINRAFSRLPDEVKDDNFHQLISVVKQRKENLDQLIAQYYDVIAKYLVLISTNKDDFIDVHFKKDNTVNIKMYRNKGGERENLIADNTYSDKLTKEVWVYGLDDDDIFTVTGQNKSKLKIRLIGGYGKDVYKAQQQSQIVIHDFKSLKNTIKANKVKTHLTDDYEENTFLRKRTVKNTSLVLPKFGFNPDDGFLIGGAISLSHKGFIGKDFTRKHHLNFGYYFDTSSYNLSYEFEHADIIGDYSAFARISYTDPSYARNFYGFGNNTPNFDEQLGRDYNRVRIRELSLNVGLRKATKYGSLFEYGLAYDAIEVNRTENRFIDEVGDELSENNPAFFENKNYLSLQANYEYESFDDKLNPSKGMVFNLKAAFTNSLYDTAQNFASLNPSVVFFNPLSINKKWVLKTQVQSQIRFGDEYEFFQAAQLGTNTGLRGFRRDRFTGKNALASSIDLRYGFNQFSTKIVPLQIGVFGGFDLGRVWLDDVTSNQWHNSYGGGFWLNMANLLTGQVNVFHSNDGFLFTFGFTTDF